MSTRTQRLYQRDATLTRFTASVLDVKPEPAEHPEASARIAVLLDRTAFYPTGGGQPHDTGLLAGLPVVDVRESEEGPLHVVEMRDEEGMCHSAHLTVGGKVEGVVDWARRFDHMQQHSGQHLLSRALQDAGRAPTRSFHLGGTGCTIDVDVAGDPAVVIREAESIANGIVWDDRPVAVREVAPAEAPAALSLDPALSGLALKPGDPIRFIEVEGFDSTACGGTHVARTGQIGLVGVTGWEPYKGLQRIAFVCGARAASCLRSTGASLSACVARLSAPPGEVVAAIERLLADRERLTKRARELAASLASLEAERLAAGAPVVGSWRLLRRVFAASERDVDEALLLARRFVADPGRAAVLAVVEGGAATLLAARSEGEGPRMGELVAEICRRFGGRGGGSPLAARAGGVPAARLEEALDAAVALLTSPAPSGRT